MDFADLLAEEIAREGAATPFADAVAAFERGMAYESIRCAVIPLPEWAALLGVAPRCSETELRSAFRRRAFETHPDRTGGSSAAFLRARRAFEEGLSALAEHERSEPPVERQTQRRPYPPTPAPARTSVNAAA